MMSFLAGWCLTEQPKELRALGSSKNGGIREERKAVPMLLITFGAGVQF